MTARFRTRTFLICFVPFAVVLACSFWLIQYYVQATVREGLRTSLRENQVALAHIHARGELQNNRFLKVAGEDAALKAGMQLFQSNSNSIAARRTVEDQLREMGQRMGFDFLLISGPSGASLAGVVRQPGSAPSHESASQQPIARELVPIDITQLGQVRSGLLILDGRTFQVASVPMDLDDQNLGALSVGQLFDFSELTTPAALLYRGEAIESNVAGVSSQELATALKVCGSESECDLRLRDANWISLPVQAYGGGFVLRSLENVDEAAAPIQSRLNRVFITLAAVGFLVALLSSMLSSRTIERPIAAVVSHLRDAASTGELTELDVRLSSISEIRQLVEIYNSAAVSVRAAGENLQAAYLEFVGSLASALDARDRYTSGHSQRVSDLCCAIASAMSLPPAEIERIRIGALLHDIGKIGVADAVLQKPGKLTDEEFAMVKEHPVIGLHILKGVQGFAPYLGAVELHHENWNGTGYPRRLSGKDVPIDARIIHVSDAYDAMTTDRSYRRGMTHERAIEILTEEAGRQFDPAIVDAFLGLPREILTGSPVMPLKQIEVEEPAMAVAG